MFTKARLLYQTLKKLDTCSMKKKEGILQNKDIRTWKNVPSGAKTLVAIADDAVLVRQALVAYINSLDGYEVAFEAMHGADLMRQLGRSKWLPHITITELNMPVKNGYETVIDLRRQWTDMQILVLSNFYNDYAVLTMLRSGANNYLPKSADKKELEKALHSLCHNKNYFGRQVSGRLMNAIASNGDDFSLPKLSEKHLQFMRYCSKGLCYKEIADRMGLSVRTVETYCNKLCKLLHIEHSRSALTRILISIGEIPFADLV
jgi:two-component system, NarL family, invasion response regulator UvrY